MITNSELFSGMRLLPWFIAAVNLFGVRDAQAAPPCPPPRHAVSSREEAITAAQSAVAAYRLTRLASDCLMFQIRDASQGQSYDVIVREKHDDACGGDLNTAPRLFTIQVAADGRLRSDARTLTSSMELVPLTCVRRRIKRKSMDTR